MIETGDNAKTEIVEPEDKKEEVKDEKEEEEAPKPWISLIENSNLRLSSLDLTVYSVLKEEIANTPNSDEVGYLKESCPKLYQFYQIMDTVFNSEDEATAECQSRFFESNKVQFNATERQI